MEIGEDVGGEREDLVAEVVPETVDEDFASGVAAAEDGLRLALGDGTQQRGEFAGRVLEVGVLDDDGVAGDVLLGGADGGALSPVDGVVQDGQVGRRRQRVQDGACAVRRAVVHDDELQVGDAAGPD